MELAPVVHHPLGEEPRDIPLHLDVELPVALVARPHVADGLLVVQRLPLRMGLRAGLMVVRDGLASVMTSVSTKSVVIPL